MPGVENRPVGPAEAGQKLVQYLLRATRKGVPQSAVLKWIRTGQVRVDGKRAKPYDRVGEGQTVRIPPYQRRDDEQPDAEALAVAPTPLPILFEDRDLLIIDKPHGLPTQPGSAHADSVVTRLTALYADADFVPTPAHRLDRDTTGVLLAAKSYASLRDLNELLAQREVQKQYLAWVAGRWEQDAPLHMADTLGKSRERGRQERVNRISREQGGKQATATATPLRHGEHASLLSIDLHTGRSNQIRAQLSLRGHPIVGDRKYGGPALTPHRLLLHCHCVVLPGRDPLVSQPDWPVPFSI